MTVFLVLLSLFLETSHVSTEVSENKDTNNSLLSGVPEIILMALLTVITFQPAYHSGTTTDSWATNISEEQYEQLKLAIWVKSTERD